MLSPTIVGAKAELAGATRADDDRRRDRGAEPRSSDGPRDGGGARGGAPALAGWGRSPTACRVGRGPGRGRAGRVLCTASGTPSRPCQPIVRRGGKQLGRTL